VLNPRSDGDLLRVIHAASRHSADTTVEHLRASANRQGLSIWEALSSSDPEMPSMPGEGRALQGVDR